MSDALYMCKCAQDNSSKISWLVALRLQVLSVSPWCMCAQHWTPDQVTSELKQDSPSNGKQSENSSRRQSLVLTASELWQAEANAPDTTLLKAHQLQWNLRVMDKLGKSVLSIIRGLSLHRSVHYWMYMEQEKL